MINDKLKEIKERIENIKNIDIDHLDKETVKTLLLQECNSIEQLLNDLRLLK